MTRKANFALAAILTLIGGLLAIVVGSVSASANDGDEPCVPTEDQTVTEWFESDPGTPWTATGNERVKTPATAGSFSDWANEGPQMRTEENEPPADLDGQSGADNPLNLTQWVPAGTVDDSTEGHWDDSDVTFYVWTGGNSADAPPVYADASQTALHPDWNATMGAPQGGPHAAAGVRVPYEAGNGPNTASWFLKSGVYIEGTEDTDYLWQQQIRTHTPGTPAVMEFEYTKTIEGTDCPDEGPEEDPAGPITFCHWVPGEGETKEGYNLITTDEHVFYTAGHLDHEDDIYPSGSFTKDGETYSWEAQGDQSLITTGCKESVTEGPPNDASASVSVELATCDDGQVLVYGEIVNATFSGTPNGTEGPGAYLVTATADEGHDFPEDKDVLTFEGVLSGPLTGDECDETEEPPVNNPPVNNPPVNNPPVSTPPVSNPPVSNPAPGRAPAEVPVSINAGL